MRVGWLVAGWALGSAVRRLSRRTGVTDAEAPRALLDHLVAVRQAITAAPTDLPPPAPRRTPPQLRRS
jgi:hypothetical protein